jgi:hypothetical protein
MGISCGPSENRRVGSTPIRVGRPTPLTCIPVAALRASHFAEIAHRGPHLRLPDAFGSRELMTRDIGSLEVYALTTICP